MTPPRPTAPTAAELRERFLKGRAPLVKNINTGRLRYIDGFEADLDALLATVRAEALEEAARAFDGPAHKVAALGFIRERIRALVSK